MSKDLPGWCLGASARLWAADGPLMVSVTGHVPCVSSPPCHQLLSFCPRALLSRCPQHSDPDTSPLRALHQWGCVYCTSLSTSPLGLPGAGARMAAGISGRTDTREVRGRTGPPWLGQQQHGERCATPASAAAAAPLPLPRALLGLRRSRPCCRDRAEPGPGQLVVGGTLRRALGSSSTWLSPRADPANQL